MVGFQGRYDTNFVDRRHTVSAKTILNYCTFEPPDGSVLNYPTVDGYCNADRVHLPDLAPYIQDTLRWTSWLRTLARFRKEFCYATDTSRTTGASGKGTNGYSSLRAA